MTQSTLENEVGRLLLLSHRTVALAESCTGGLLGHLITNVPGCSSYFVGSVVAYHDRVKVELLGVSQDTLALHGAVSAFTALEMARGVRRTLGADIGLAVTGIAGPAGGTAQKPVGLAFIALVDEGGYEVCNEYHWTGDREANKACSAEAALDMLRAYLSRLTPPTESPMPRLHRGATGHENGGAILGKYPLSCSPPKGRGGVPSPRGGKVRKRGLAKD